MQESPHAESPRQSSLSFERQLLIAIVSAVIGAAATLASGQVGISINNDGSSHANANCTGQSVGAGPDQGSTAGPGADLRSLLDQQLADARERLAGAEKLLREALKEGATCSTRVAGLQDRLRIQETQASAQNGKAKQELASLDEQLDQITRERDRVLREQARLESRVSTLEQDLRAARSTGAAKTQTSASLAPPRLVDVTGAK